MADGLCTSCQGLQRVIDQWKKRDELDRYRADAAEAEVDRLRAERDTAMVFLPHCTCGGGPDHCTVCDLKRRVADR